MAVQYDIQNGVLFLRLAPEGFAHLRDALTAAAGDPASRPGMPLLLDLRGESPRVRYQDVRWRVEILAEMQKQFGPRWAFLTDPEPVRVGIGQMFAVFSRVHGLTVRVFSDLDAALAWLRDEP